MQFQMRGRFTKKIHCTRVCLIFKSPIRESVFRDILKLLNHTRSEIFDIVSHPRDLNTVFLLFAGGVILYDLVRP